MLLAVPHSVFFFFNDTATTEIYTLSLHDALPICSPEAACSIRPVWRMLEQRINDLLAGISLADLTHDEPELRSEEHTSELQSRLHLVCRLLLEKKKTNTSMHILSAFTRKSLKRTH